MSTHVGSLSERSEKWHFDVVPYFCRDLRRIVERAV